MFNAFIVAAALASVLSVSVRGVPTVAQPPPVPIITNGPAIASGLRTESSSIDRFEKLLTDGSGNRLSGESLRQLTVFDFNNQAPVAGAPGGSILLGMLDISALPRRLKNAQLGRFDGRACGLNIPHFHLRASEMLTVVDGILDTGFIQENGFNTQIETQLGKFQATVFPMGSIHYQQNPTCSPAVFVASLNNEDPGRSDIATSFWMLPSDVVNAALGFPETIGGSTIDAWRAHLPANLAAGVDSCLQACGLKM
ncbi:RmlC-like cupin domain-containing protein [Mycena galopus ATCC 62051]|nr:RmlC-like cupin domain-containing protein [Mycena galopus ATCC 62051]